jgi:hypothetical protein
MLLKTTSPTSYAASSTAVTMPKLAPAPRTGPEEVGVAPAVGAQERVVDHAHQRADPSVDTHVSTGRPREMRPGGVALRIDPTTTSEA